MGKQELKLKFQDTKLNFDPEKHIYDYDGQVLTSVTSFLKQWFPFDKDGIASMCARRRKTTKEAILQEWTEKANFGTYIHALAEKYANGEELTNTEEQEISHVITFFEETKLKPFLSEAIVWSTTLGIAGTIDLIAEDEKGDFWIVDWKTSSQITISGEPCSWPLQNLNNANFYSYSLQLNVYKFLLENEFGFAGKIAGMLIIQLMPNKTYKKIAAEELQAETTEILFLN